MTRETCGSRRRPSFFRLVLTGAGGPGLRVPPRSATEYMHKIYVKEIKELPVV